MAKGSRRGKPISHNPPPSMYSERTLRASDSARTLRASDSARTLMFWDPPPWSSSRDLAATPSPTIEPDRSDSALSYASPLSTMDAQSYSASYRSSPHDMSESAYFGHLEASPLPSPSDSRGSTPFLPGGMRGRFSSPSLRPQSPSTSHPEPAHNPFDSHWSSVADHAPPAMSLRDSSSSFSPSLLTPATATFATTESGNPFSVLWGSFSPISGIPPPFSDHEQSSSPTKLASTPKPPVFLSPSTVLDPPPLSPAGPKRSAWKDVAKAKRTSRLKESSTVSEVKAQDSPRANAPRDSFSPVVARPTAAASRSSPSPTSQRSTATSPTSVGSTERLNVQAPIFVPRCLTPPPPMLWQGPEAGPAREQACRYPLSPDWPVARKSSSDQSKTASEESSCEVLSTPRTPSPAEITYHSLEQRRSPSPPRSSPAESYAPSSEPPSPVVIPLPSPPGFCRIRSVDHSTAPSVCDSQSVRSESPYAPICTVLLPDPCMLPIIVHPPSRFSSSPPSPSSPARSITPEKRDAEQPVLADSSASALTETDKACDSAKASSRRHPEFYIQDEMKVMEVGGCLFRVHRYILEQESEYMRQLFVKDGESGSSDDAAIILADVTRQEFECLLRFLYHRTPDAHSSSPVGDLLALLSVATRLSYPKIRAHAIARLDACAPPLDPIERIILAEKHGIEQWLLPAYVAVCQRCHPLEDAEAEVLGVQTATRIARVRERILGEFIAGLQRMLRQEDVGADAPKMDDARVVRAVRDVFGL